MCKNPRKIVGVGMNYIDHLERVNFFGGPRVPPEHFIFFQKPVSSITGPYDPVFIPRDCYKLDYENEIGVIISKPAKYIDKANAYEYIAGFCIANDVSERSLQLQQPGQHEMGKSSDSFCPLGPFIVTPDDVDIVNMHLCTKLNGEIKQNGNTKSMIFEIPHLLAELSKYFTLQAGDIILTGTPHGVQLEEEILGNTPHYLQEGDVIELSITGLGYQRNVIKRD
ncbi:fumarylacetoacetate hydrolase family protein [Cysteiniphilum halobium]|uniref:fumarylacetoacetate hydrolase family protein n=1 Tax=Cysteiniphilum halobium TaxID=2219059 RepID=UPI002E27408B